MARRAVKEKLGHALRINETGTDGATNWRMVGFLFKSKHLAREYLKQHFPRVARYTIGAVRVSTVPLPTNGWKDDKVL